MNNETLVFVELQGKEEDRIYDLYFSLNSDSAWGDDWNVCPSAIVPNIKIDDNCCSSVVRIVLPDNLLLASKNTCFSMQDCIDGVIPLAFPDVIESELIKGEKPLIMRFGAGREEIIENIEKHGGRVLQEHDMKNSADDMIDDLIDNIDNFDF